MGLGLSHNISNVSLGFSSACITAVNIPALALGFRYAKRLWNDMAEESGSNLKSVGELRSFSHWQTGVNRMSAKPPNLAEILMVEDSHVDVLMTREAFEQARLINTLHVVEDGVKAMQFLRQEAEYASSPRPDLILLDLNLPRKNGHEVLAEIKTDPDLKAIPIVILTTSQAEKDILEAYDLHANCYIVKPVGFENFVEAVRSIQQFWFSVVTLP
jgi:CheY-like chemotaxis protein